MSEDMRAAPLAAAPTPGTNTSKDNLPQRKTAVKTDWLKLEDRRHRYGLNALQRIVDEVEGTGTGARNNVLRDMGLRAFRLLVGNDLVRSDVVQEALRTAGRTAGLSEDEIRNTLASSQRSAERMGPAPPPADMMLARVDVQRSIEPDLPAPPPAEVQDLVRRCKRVWGTPQAAELVARRIDPATCEDEDLVRVLPAGPLPRWARSRAGTWRESGHLLIVPTYGADGALRSVCARTFRQDLPDGVQKSLNPAGFTTKGQVFADAMGRALLAGETPTGWSGEVWAAEGSPDYLTLACYTSDAADVRPAVLGYAAGGWTHQIGARLPAAATVYIFAHADDSGQNMAERIVGTVPQCRAYIQRGPHGRA